MLYHIFDLSDYYEKTYYNFVTFDVLFKTEKQTKEAILQKLGIASSSYRKARRMEQKNGIEMVYILNDYFKIKLINPNKLEVYQKCLARILTKLNYQTDELLEVELKEIQSFIADENILRPIFELFSLLITITNNKLSLKKIMDITLEKYKYVKSYENLYSDEIKVIYFMVQCFYETSNKIQFDKVHEILQRVNYAKGMYYYLLTSRFFIEGNYPAALAYAQRAEKIFLEECNQNRLISIKSNICQLYLLLGNYALACEACEEFASAMYAYQRGRPTYYNFKMQFYEALYMCKRMDKLIETIEFQDKMDHIDYLFLFIYSVKNNHLNALAKIISDYDKALLSKELEAYSIMKHLFAEYTNKKLERPLVIHNKILCKIINDLEPVF